MPPPPQSEPLAVMILFLITVDEELPEMAIPPPMDKGRMATLSFMIFSSMVGPAPTPTKMPPPTSALFSLIRLPVMVGEALTIKIPPPAVVWVPLRLISLPLPFLIVNPINLELAVSPALKFTALPLPPPSITVAATVAGSSGLVLRTVILFPKKSIFSR